VFSLVVEGFLPQSKGGAVLYVPERKEMEMTDLRKAAEMALEALDCLPWQASPIAKEATQALRKALAEGVKQEIKLYDDGVKPKRKWVNATHIEIGNLWAQHKEVYGFAMALDDLLKDKNQ
jgi:hypothetical protein